MQHFYWKVASESYIYRTAPATPGQIYRHYRPTTFQSLLFFSLFSVIFKSVSWIILLFLGSTFYSLHFTECQLFSIYLVFPRGQADQNQFRRVAVSAPQLHLKLFQVSVDSKFGWNSLHPQVEVSRPSGTTRGNMEQEILTVFKSNTGKLWQFREVFIPLNTFKQKYLLKGKEARKFNLKEVYRFILLQGNLVCYKISIKHDKNMFVNFQQYIFYC